MSAELAHGLALVVVFLLPLGILSGALLLAPFVFPDWRTLTPEGRRRRMAWCVVGMFWLVAGLELVTGNIPAMYGGLALLMTGLMLLPTEEKKRNGR